MFMNELKDGKRHEWAKRFNANGWMIAIIALVCFFAAQHIPGFITTSPTGQTVIGFTVFALMIVAIIVLDKKRR